MFLGTWTDEEKAAHKKKSEDGGGCHSDMDDDEIAVHKKKSEDGGSSHSDMDDDEIAAHKKKCEDGGGCHVDDPCEIKLRQTLNSNSKKNDLQQRLQHVYQTNEGEGENALEFRKRASSPNPAINRKISIVFHTFEENDEWEEQTAYVMFDSTDEEELFSLERARVTYNGLAKLLFPKKQNKNQNFDGHKFLYIAGTSDRICDMKIE